MLMTNTRLDTTVHSSTVVVTTPAAPADQEVQQHIGDTDPQMGKKIRYHTRRLSWGRETRCEHSSSRYMTDCTATIITTRVAEGSSAADIFRGGPGTRETRRTAAAENLTDSGSAVPRLRCRSNAWAAGLSSGVDRSGSAIK